VRRQERLPPLRLADHRHRLAARVDWLVIEDCQCGGLFLWAGLPAERFTQLSREARARLTRHIRGLRTSARDAWCTTDDGTPTGPLVIRTERPDRPT
jgi:hypothetical protein